MGGADGAASQNAEGACSVARVIQEKGLVVRIVVMEAVRIDKAPAELHEQMLWPRLVLAVVARVQVRNTDTRLSELDSVTGSGKLGEVVAQMPGELTRWPDRLVVVSILMDRGTSPLPFRIHAGTPRHAPNPVRRTVCRPRRRRVDPLPGRVRNPKGWPAAPGDRGRSGRSAMNHSSGAIDPEAGARSRAVEHGTEVSPRGRRTTRR